MISCRHWCVCVCVCKPTGLSTLTITLSTVQLEQPSRPSTSASVALWWLSSGRLQAAGCIRWIQFRSNDWPFGQSVSIGLLVAFDQCTDRVSCDSARALCLWHTVTLDTWCLIHALVSCSNAANLATCCIRAIPSTPRLCS